MFFSVSTGTVYRQKLRAAALVATVIFLVLQPGCAQGTDGAPENIPPGADVSADTAYELWKADPDGVTILDVRTRAEYALVGHPPMAHNIPLAFWTGRFDSGRGNYRMEQNPDFLAQVKNRIDATDRVLVLCRSGQRSGFAASLLQRAGFERVHNIADGFEGRIIADPDGLITGNSFKDGWKQSGAPWTYELDPALVYDR